jgi:tetratricopeptide (TPR) repeat protein
MPSLPPIDTLWDFSNPMETESKFSELLPAAKEQDVAYHAELLTQIARTQGLQRKFDEAHATLDEAGLLITREMVVPQIRYYLERGRVYNSSGKKEKASGQFHLALDLATGHGHDYYAIDAAHMLGITEPEEAQLNWNLKAIDMAENSNDPKARKWLGSLYNNTGWSYHDMEQYEAALDLFQRSLKWREEQNDPQGIFIAKWTIGRTFRSLNRIEDALEMQLSLLKEIEAGTAKADGYVYEEIAECLLVKEGREAAKPFFAKAYNLLKDDPWLPKEQVERMRSFLKK